MVKVLIVDDDPDIRALYGLVLRRQGWGVIEAESGQEALSKARAESPALVLLDVMMPEMDGYEVCRRLRANPQTTHLPILMTSAKATGADRIKGLQAGANGFLAKSVGPQVLVANIQTLLSTSLASDGIAPFPVPSV